MGWGKMKEGESAGYIQNSDGSKTPLKSWEEIRRIAKQKEQNWLDSPVRDMLVRLTVSPEVIQTVKKKAQSVITRRTNA